MKQTIRLTENELKRMISESIKRVLNEEIDYTSVADWNKDLSNTDNEYEYYRMLDNAKDNLRMQGKSAQLHLPSTTPWASEDPNDLSSMDSVDFLYSDPEELERIADKRRTKVYPSGLDEAVRRSIKKVLKQL